MQRNELKTIAEGFKKARPELSTTGDRATDDQNYTFMLQWRKDVEMVAAALQLVDKARSNFLAACGHTHAQG